MTKYLLCKPQGGFCDNLDFINICVYYCKKYNRVLLLNTNHSWTYKINFADYFYFNKTLTIKVITDINKINQILSIKRKSVYPNFMTNNIINFRSRSTNNGYYWINDKLKRPLTIDISKNYQEDILIYEDCSRGGFGNILELFKSLEFKDNILEDFYNKYNSIKKPYICIQIRNSDIKCNYQKIYDDNIQLIHKYNNIVIATDDKLAINFFKNKGLKINNFTTFPKNILKNQGLHYSNLSSDVKIKDTISDLLLISLADIILSVSGGSFINLGRELNKDKDIIFKKLRKIKIKKHTNLNNNIPKNDIPKNDINLLKLIGSKRI